MKDSVGAVCSGLCVIHCLVTPFLIAGGTLGTAGVLFLESWLHALLLAPIVVIALLSFPASFRRHGRLLPGLLAVVGISGLITALFLDESLELPFTMAAASAMAIAHLWNARLMSISIKSAAMSE